MPVDPSLPKHLQHLLEKRQGVGRRKIDGAKPAMAPVEQKLPASIDRRKSSRRKAKSPKTRKTS